ncbi:NADP-dependent 3-hydroxy acid dehydrogenase YdfG [Thermosporothrix hazakensis]|uniref:NADP-dependent 3-hydroxy acid dehydrogenase YdfG n=1 Tax=Thermosporothrix hazakensis TaxID=644383 RepID=A0A326UCB0_THEHA|nr:SDR family oxidoreductase [Thermosporothrix hazakensis]PZW26316.1 NADP-dependent 3-hydroxy acid dehydrogenase YdfG [Thermosporothrix hazakensis]GCE48733.1 short-chain dehydrogenase [Thermosporothrix hazakensis]
MGVEPISLRDKVVLVTGAGSGLGEATAHAFAEQGCMVACVDIKQKDLESVCAVVQQQDGRVAAFPCDVSNAAAVFETVQAAVERFGRLDIVVNCAAIDHTLSVADMSVEQWDQVISINLRGPFLFAKAALPHMQRQKSGHIVNVASTAATRAWANASAYHASKWGLVGFSRGLGVEGREHGIRVTTIIPGGMKTHFFDRFAEQGIPMPEERNLQDPANVAELIVFATQVPANSALQEALITPFTETSWP